MCTQCNSDKGVVNYPATILSIPRFNLCQDVARRMLEIVTPPEPRARELVFRRKFQSELKRLSFSLLLTNPARAERIREEYLNVLRCKLIGMASNAIRVKMATTSEIDLRFQGE